MVLLWGDKGLVRGIGVVLLWGDKGLVRGVGVASPLGGIRDWLGA